MMILVTETATPMLPLQKPRRARPMINIAGLNGKINKAQPVISGIVIARSVPRRPMMLIMYPTRTQTTAAPILRIEVKSAHSEN